MKSPLSELFGTDIRQQNMAILHSREVVQKIVLNGLSRGFFFKKAAFQGGTALRMLYSLGRYSEDLDFVLFEKDPDFRLDRYITFCVDELRSYGLTVRSKVREGKGGSISTGTIGCRTQEVMLEIGFPDDLLNGIHPESVLKVKIDVDTYPPAGARYDRRVMSDPLNYYLCVLDLPTLFAGKISAVLCRGWKNRVKGRDLFDFEWYVGRDVPVNLAYLKSLLVRGGAMSGDEGLDIGKLKLMLGSRFESIDYRSAADDVSRFVAEESELERWGPDHFAALSENLRAG